VSTNEIVEYETTAPGNGNIGMPHGRIQLSDLTHDLIRKVCNFSGSCHSRRRTIVVKSSNKGEGALPARFL
jgi:hypothetical protein